MGALAHAIHLWSFPSLHLEPSQQQLSDLQSILSPDEAGRAGRFHFAAHRNAYIANRGRLRLLLAHYLGCRPQDLRFDYGPQGKPELADAKEHGLNFNLSHTDGLAMVAVAQQRRLGTDVEKIVPAADILEIARQHFSPAEYGLLCATNPFERLHAFYRCWTRKEALLKGLGDGLQRELDGFQVSFSPEQPAALLACEWDPSLCQSWRIHHLEPGDGYLGALAYEDVLPVGQGAIQAFTWSD